MTGRRILIISDGGINAGLAGTDLRVSQLVSVLAHQHEVTLVGNSAHFDDSGCRSIVSLSDKSLRSLIAQNDVIISRPGLLGAYHHNQILRSNKYLVTDLFIPQSVEGLHYFGTLQSSGQLLYNKSQRRLRRALKLSDFFLCASNTQKLYWLGALTTARNFPVSAISKDPLFSSLIGIFPYGIDENKPFISLEDKSLVPSPPYNVLWGGGLWDWTDPELLLEAALQLSPELKRDIKIQFPGTVHPQSTVPFSPLVPKIRSMVEGSSQLQQLVTINPSWTSPPLYSDLLLKCSLGISLHKEGVESFLSWRFRIVSYIENLIPVVVTENCPLAELIQGEGGGIVIPAGDRVRCSNAINELLTNHDLYRESVRSMVRVRELLALSTLSDSLLQYCNEPYRAADLMTFSWKDSLKLIFP